MKPTAPRLPLRPGAFTVLDRDEKFMARECAPWLNRASDYYRSERPKLRRALREAIAEIEAGVGGPRDATEEEVALLVRLHRALGPMALRRFLKNWRTKR